MIAMQEELNVVTITTTTPLTSYAKLIASTREQWVTLFMTTKKIAWKKTPYIADESQLVTTTTGGHGGERIPIPAMNYAK